MEWQDKFNKIEISVQDQTKLAAAIGKAINESKRKHPQFINADPNDHGISGAELNDRIDWCVDFVVECRRERGYSIERICDILPRELDAHLDTRTLVIPKRSAWVS